MSDTTVPAGPEVPFPPLPEPPIVSERVAREVRLNVEAYRDALLAAHPVPADLVLAARGVVDAWPGVEDPEAEYGVRATAALARLETALAARPVPAVDEDRAALIRELRTAFDAAVAAIENAALRRTPRAVDEDRERLAALIDKAWESWAAEDRDTRGDLAPYAADYLLRAGVALSTGDEP